MGHLHDSMEFEDSLRPIASSRPRLAYRRRSMKRAVDIISRPMTNESEKYETYRSCQF
jgi:hypothetical protein